MPEGKKLERECHAVTVVGDGRAAVRAFDGGEFDVVVSDVRMPGPDGMAVLRHARARDARTEFILITGSGTEETALSGMKTGALHFVKKPFRNETILGLLEHPKVGAATERSVPVFIPGAR